MRARMSHPAAGFALAAAAALLCGACGDSGSAKGSPGTGTPAKTEPAKKAPEPLPDIPKEQPIEPTKPMNEPAVPPTTKPAETKTPPAPPPPIEKKPVGELASYHCDSCGKDAVANSVDPAPTCCGVVMRPKP